MGGCLLCIAGIALIVLKNAKVAKKNVRSASEASWQSLDELTEQRQLLLKFLDNEGEMEGVEVS